MSQEELVHAYLRGDVSRRTFIRRLVAGGVSLAAAIAYTHALSPSPAAAAEGDLYEDTRPPGVVTAAATGVGGGAATLNGQVDPNLQRTLAYFEYGTTTSYGSHTAIQNLAPGSAPQPVGAPLAGLPAGQTYHFRLVATNGSGETRGADQSFAIPDVAKPNVGVSVLDTDLAGVIATGKLRMLVKGDEASTVSLAAEGPAVASGAARKRKKRKPLTVAKGRVRFTRADSKVATLKLTRKGKRYLRRRKKSASLTVVSTARDATGNRSVKRKKLKLSR